MKIKYIFIVLLVFITTLLFVPMPHGGNIAEGAFHELKTYFSVDAQKARKKEKEKWEQQKQKASESWKKFEQENSRFFDK